MNQEEGINENCVVSVEFYLYTAVEFYLVTPFISYSKHVVITWLHVHL